METERSGIVLYMVNQGLVVEPPRCLDLVRLRCSHVMQGIAVDNCEIWCVS